jgi:hypothetical protein
MVENFRGEGIVFFSQFVISRVEIIVRSNGVPIIRMR